MTKEELEQLRFLKREAKQLREQRNGLERGLRQLKESDSVKGSFPDHPYTKHSIHIEGVGSIHHGAYEALETHLREVLRLLEENERKRILEYQKITEYIQTVPDSELRQILYWRFIKGLSWVSVAMRTGGKNTASGTKSTVYRYLEKQ